MQQSPSTSSETPSRYLLSRAARTLVAIPLDQVSEIMRPLPVTPLVGLPSFLMGVAVIRGRPTPVVDAGAVLSPAEKQVPSRFVLVRTGQRLVALAFESVLGVGELPPRILQDTPALLGRAAGDVVEAIGTLDSALLLVFAAARAIPEEAYRSLEAAGAQP